MTSTPPLSPLTPMTPSAPAEPYEGHLGGRSGHHTSRGLRLARAARQRGLPGAGGRPDVFDFGGDDDDSLGGGNSGREGSAGDTLAGDGTGGVSASSGDGGGGGSRKAPTDARLAWLINRMAVSFGWKTEAAAAALALEDNARHVAEFFEQAEVSRLLVLAAAGTQVTCTIDVPSGFGIRGGTGGAGSNDRGAAGLRRGASGGTGIGSSAIPPGSPSVRGHALDRHASSGSVLDLSYGAARLDDAFRVDHAPAAFASKSLYFVKRKPAVVTRENIRNLLIYGGLDPHVLAQVCLFV